MADQCIVCLEDLGVIPGLVPDDLEDGAAASPADVQITIPSSVDSHLPIALIKPCNHVLHDECLREWSQKANSCPICRHSFNIVEVLDRVGGTVLSEYKVEDRKQVAEFDANAWIEDNLEDEPGTPCPICGEADQEEVLLLCDGCDATYHTHCVNLDRVPRGTWYCMECESEGAYVQNAQPPQLEDHRREPMSGRFCPRTQASEREARHLLRHDHWYGAWNRVTTSIHSASGVDVDFPEDDELGSYRRQHQHLVTRTDRETRRWQQRLRIADRQGARDFFRAAARPILRRQVPQTPVVLSAEETKAWSAFEKAKEIDTVSPKTRKRKSRSATASPIEAPREPERRLKRPRTRRILHEPASEQSASSPIIASSSHQPTSNSRPHSPSRSITNANEEPSFLSSLLKEVEMATASDDDIARTAFAIPAGPNRITSPSNGYSSPATSPSPLSSTLHTPRAMSVTPPPHITKRPGSPLPLSSHVEPVYPATNYYRNKSPECSPAEATPAVLELRHPRPRKREEIQLSPSSDTIPVRAMSIEAKEDINKLVKRALSPHWKSSKITKEQYAEINRSVSRKLYEIVADRDVSDQTEKHNWEKIATTEVAATTLKTSEGTTPSAPRPHNPPVAASTSPMPEYIIKTGILLSRPPILTRPQSPFEKAFFFYQKRLNERLAMPFTRYFYFKKDTPADADWKLKVKERNGAAAKELGGYQAYGEMGWNDEVLVGDTTAEPKFMREILARDAVMRAVEKEEGVDVQRRETEIMDEQVELPLERHTEADEKKDVRRLDRKLARTLYLCVKRVNSGWGFPSGPLIGRENLHQAAERVLVQTGGLNMNTWIVGHAPIGHHVIRPRFGSDSALATPGEKTFFMKGHPESNTKYGGITNLYRCGAEGTLQMNVCCALNQMTTTDTCCGNTFTYSISRFSFQAGTDAQLLAAANTGSNTRTELETEIQMTTVTTSVATATVIATVTSTAASTTVTVFSSASGAAASSLLSEAGSSSSDNTTTCTTNSTSNLGLPIGIGVGVPLGALCLGLLAFLFYRENKNQLRMDNGYKHSNPSTSTMSDISLRDSPSYIGSTSGT
ncbi:hypothetical protein B7494_g5936 [Chlorociboria aeruginascens]|nr:hypothetical protein B7494_g5936 [Chlorociboria aeruginascens]